MDNKNKITEKIINNKNTVKTGKKQGKIKAKKLGGQSGNRFVSGQSGNPKGRPKGQKNFMTKIKEAIEIISKDNKTDIELKIAKTYVTNLLKGDFNFMKLYWNYSDGKPQDNLDVTSNGDVISANDFNLSSIKDKIKYIEEKIK